ncbi:MAG: DinB family protein [Pseudomonadota bacterium]
MISVEYAQTMSRYGAWQNESLAHATDSLMDPARREDRGAFFGSIFGTLNHLLWADRIWMSRFAATEPPRMASIAASIDETDDWQTYRVERRAMDETISDWTSGLTTEWLTGDLTWWSGAAGREMTRSKPILLVHFFNHGTHHRGQVHAMLTGAGLSVDDTDLPKLPISS